MTNRTRDFPPSEGDERSIKSEHPFLSTNGAIKKFFSSSFFSLPQELVVMYTGGRYGGWFILAITTSTKTDDIHVNARNTKDMIIITIATSICKLANPFALRPTLTSLTFLD